MYRAKNRRSGQYMIHVKDPKTKFGGDVGAYWRYTYEIEEATIFKSYAEAEMAEIMLNNANIIVVNMQDDFVTREQAIADKNFHSVDVRV